MTFSQSKNSVQQLMLLTCKLYTYAHYMDQVLNVVLGFLLPQTGDIDPVVKPEEPEMLGIISYVGCAICILGVLLTLMTYLLFP